EFLLDAKLLAQPRGTRRRPSGRHCGLRYCRPRILGLRDGSEEAVQRLDGCSWAAAKVDHFQADAVQTVFPPTVQGGHMELATAPPAGHVGAGVAKVQRLFTLQVDHRSVLASDKKHAREYAQARTSGITRATKKPVLRVEKHGKNR